MVKVRTGLSRGIDTDQVVGWSVYSQKQTAAKDADRLLTVWFAGETLGIWESEAGELAFNRFHKLLLDMFPIDLSATGEAE